jgi:acyl-CoA synthetase (NDP forming)
MFLETIRDPAALAEACQRAHHNGKILLAVKVGRTEVARRAVAAHSAGVAGEDKIVDAHLSKVGVTRLDDLDELVNACELFLRHPISPKVRGCVVVTMSGGEAALVGDVAADVGLSLPALANKTRSRLRDHLPSFLTPANPLDAYGLGYTQERFCAILDAFLEDPDIGTAVVATDAPAGGTVDAGLARQMAAAMAERASGTSTRLAFLNNTSGGGRDTMTDETLAAVGIPYLLGLREGLAALANWQVRPSPRSSAGHDGWRTRFQHSIAGVLSEDEEERFRSLSDLGLPMAETRRVSNVKQAVDVARTFGFPVVMKGTAPQIVHKTELKLIRLGLRDEEGVRQAFSELKAQLDQLDCGPSASIVVQRESKGDLELIVGVRNDTAFGPGVVVGLGGMYTEVLQDSAVAIGPVDSAEAKALLRRTRIGALLEGRRSQGPYDIDAIGDSIALFSRLGAAVADTVAAMEINPLIVGPGLGAVSAVDLVVEHHTSKREEAPSG